MNLARCTPADEILVAYVTDITMQKKVMTKKRSSDFWSGKVHPRRENPGYTYGRVIITARMYIVSVYRADVFKHVPVALGKQEGFSPAI